MQSKESPNEIIWHEEIEASDTTHARAWHTDIATKLETLANRLNSKRVLEESKMAKELSEEVREALAWLGEYNERFTRANVDTLVAFQAEAQELASIRRSLQTASATMIKSGSDASSFALPSNGSQSTLKSVERQVLAHTASLDNISKKLDRVQDQLATKVQLEALQDEVRKLKRGQSAIMHSQQATLGFVQGADATSGVEQPPAKRARCSAPPEMPPATTAMYETMLDWQPESVEKLFQTVGQE